MKIIFIFLLAAVLSGCSAQQTVSVSTKSESYETVLPTAYPENTVITVSAAGDCTLATDEKAQGYGSFESVLKRNNYDYSYFFKNVKHIFDNDDISIVNLECALSERGTRKDKEFAFRGKSDYAQILTYGGIDAVNLANNHSRDYGMAAYEDTLNITEQYGLASFGYEKTAVYEAKGIKIGMMGYTALEGTSENSAKKLISAGVKSLEEKGADIIILSMHWGVEGENIPYEKQKSIGRYAVDSGADVVIGHHPHVIQGIEKYKERYIVYSLGNFCFGGNRNPSDKDTFIFRQSFEFADGKCVSYNEPVLIPCSVSSEKSRNNFQPTPYEGEDRERVLKRIDEYSKRIT